MNLKGPYASASPALRLEMHYYTGFCYFDLDARDLNSGPHSSMENTSPTEPSLQPFFFATFKNRKLKITHRTHILFLLATLL